MSSGLGKVLAIARAEYLEAVRSKAFLVGILVMPVLMGGSIAFQALVGDQVDLDERACAVVDPTGEVMSLLQAANAQRDEAIWEVDEDGERKQVRPAFLFESYAPEGEDARRADVVLSERVEDGDLQGFVLVDEGLWGDEELERPLAYHTDEPTFTELPDWIEGTVQAAVRASRLQREDIDPEAYGRVQRGLSLSTWGLVEQREDGTIQEAEKENKLRTFGIPFAALMLLFMLIMTGAPQLMNQVLEEKMQRISEVLVSAVTPFQLMLGKLFGSVGVCLTLAMLYLGGIYWATHHFEVEHFVPTSAYLWFIVMMVFGLLMYGSLFSALGSACSELRDAQSLMAPALILLMIPLFTWNALLESPNGSLAVAMTYVPTATPMVFLVRLLAPPGPPAWELLAAPAMCIATTLALIWASGKIFRIGVLSQGQAPSFRQLLGWVFSKQV